LSIVVAACGCGGERNGDVATAQQTTQSGGRHGGTLTALWSGDVDAIDCGISYYLTGYQVCLATQRALYGYRPGDTLHMVPDLAAGAPEVSADGRSVTVRIRRGVRYSPPVNRAVTSKDVKYAIERGFFSTVNSPYAGTYFGGLIGAKSGAEPGTKLDQGLTTPDDRTIVFHLDKPTAGVLASGALGLPLTAPVPEQYAAKFDRHNPSTYGKHQVATGPYMLEHDAAGSVVGYKPGQSIHLVRNPRWDRSSDFKPAYLNDIRIKEGNSQVGVASRQVLAGRSLVSGDWTPPPRILEDASKTKKDQLVVVRGSTVRYVSMNTKIKPFDNLNVRKAVIAAFDRNAMRLARGGAFVGDIATHFLAPGVRGFDEAGGKQGFGFDFINTSGKPNPQRATEYMKKAGYPSGKYTGTERVLMMGASTGTDRDLATVARRNLEKLGFHVTLRTVSKETMYTSFCQVPAAKVAVCLVAFGKDFPDAQSMLDPSFNGENILPQGNLNFAQLDVPAINRAIDKAKLLTDPGERAKAWSRIDRLVTAQAPGVPWLWDKWPLIQSKNVHGVANGLDYSWDFAWTSLK
jgi:peptide/nickel transport system substrate-binding protein